MFEAIKRDSEMKSQLDSTGPVVERENYSLEQLLEMPRSELVAKIK